MKLSSMLVCALVAVSLLTMAGAARAHIPGGKLMVVVSEKNASGVVEVAYDGVVRVDLYSPKKQGRWHIASQNVDVMTPIVREGNYRGQILEFDFKALNEGVDDIRFEFIDPMGKVVKTFNVSVRVGPRAEKPVPVK